MKFQHIIVLTIIILFFGCKKEIENVSSDPVEIQNSNALKKSSEVLDKKKKDELLNSIDGLDFISYFSGYYTNMHSFPCVVFDPKQQKIIVSAPKYQQIFNLTELDHALASFLSILKNKGYKIDGKVIDNNQYVWVNGQKMVYVAIEDIVPNEEFAKKQFSAEQYNVIYGGVTAFQAFTYVSGYENSSRDYPLIVAMGYKEDGRLFFMNKDSSNEYTFDTLNEVFQMYQKYIKERMNMNGDIKK